MGSSHQTAPWYRVTELQIQSEQWVRHVAACQWDRVCAACSGQDSQADDRVLHTSLCTAVWSGKLGTSGSVTSLKMCPRSESKNISTGKKRCNSQIMWKPKEKVNFSEKWKLVKNQKWRNCNEWNYWPGLGSWLLHLGWLPASCLVVKWLEKWEDHQVSEKIFARTTRTRD